MTLHSALGSVHATLRTGFDYMMPKAPCSSLFRDCSDGQRRGFVDRLSKFVRSTSETIGRGGGLGTDGL